MACSKVWSDDVMRVAVSYDRVLYGLHYGMMRFVNVRWGNVGRGN